MKSTLSTLIVLAMTLGILLIASGAAAVDRQAVAPEPVNHGAGLSIGDRDAAAPYMPGTQEKDEHRLDPAAEAALRRTIAETKILKDNDVGGDDEIISSDELHRTCDIDIASNGDIYVALETGDFAGESGMDIWVFRSQDGGDSWQNWGRFYNSETYGDLESPCILVAEGSIQRCYLAYRQWEPSYDGGVIRVAWSDLSAASGSWTIVTAMDIADISFNKPDLATDADVYDPFYLYLAADGYETTGRDIWFSRCTNNGTSWDTPYRIAELTTDDRGYHDPSVSYGYGGYIHVAWHFEMNDDSMDDAIRYRRAEGFGTGGITSWGAIQYLTLNSNDKWEHDAVIHASPTSNEVMIVSGTFVNINYVTDPTQLYSTDQGATFGYQGQIPFGLIFPESLDRTDTGDWILGGGTSYPWGPGIQRASAAMPTVWSAEQQFIDDSSGSGTVWGSSTALDPTRDDRSAAVWVDLGVEETTPNMLKFDAEWRNDPGYPNLMAGFPIDLDHEPVSPPAIVDLLGDGRPEVVYGDNFGRIHAWQYDGSEPPGFPISTGHALSDGPVAVGALTPGGQNFIAAGTADGHVVVYNVNGVAADGWPLDLDSDAPVYVTLGALGAPRVRSVVICYGNRLTYRDYRCRSIPGFYGWYYPDRLLTTPAAVGDVDGDGVNDVAVGVANTAIVYDPRIPASKMYHSCTSTISDQITLGDVDNDGDVEIFVPTIDGTLYGLQDDGAAAYPSFPFVASTETPLTSAAIAQCLGTWEPEIAVAAQNYNVHLLYGSSGEETPWSPYDTGYGWYLLGMPVMGRIDGTSSDVVIGDRSMQGWAWSNIGVLIPGWPEAFADRCQLSPAIGDLNADGATEVVFLTLGQLIVYEINQAPADDFRTWPMYGHNPQRTGCADCPEDLVTPVVEESGMGITRVSFAPPSPNPMSREGTFRFAVPIRAAASLEIYDLRGRLLRTVLREEVELGERAVTWDGRDNDGREVAAGQYLARLRVRGPGLDEQMVRKLVLLR